MSHREIEKEGQYAFQRHSFLYKVFPPAVYTVVHILPLRITRPGQSLWQKRESNPGPHDQ
jgi:hypothetical protein